jgi:hypothetical protein
MVETTGNGDYFKRSYNNVLQAAIWHTFKANDSTIYL